MTKRVGPTSVSDIKDRCRIDSETGCWNWAWGLSGKPGFPIPMTHLGVGVCGMTKVSTTPAYRAAWLLSGKPIEKGQVIYRDCCNALCCNPAHLKIGQRSDMYAHYAATGRNKGQPHRLIACAKNREKMMVSPERVRQVEEMLAQGMLQKDIKVAMQMCGYTVRKIREGRHPNCSSSTAQRLVRGASIFNMGVSV